MWFLVWFSFMNGKLDYYQIGGFHTSEEQCELERASAKVLITDRNQGLFCLETSREG